MARTPGTSSATAGKASKTASRRKAGDAQAERSRLAEAAGGSAPWRDWGPYLSERAWGTVREDYSADGDAWSFFPHDHARSRVYRWNEDGMAGFCDETQNWCLSLALWNGADPILKERMFGLAGPQGNHGEDVKEYWWFLDGTPTHSWNTWRYHYPQRAYPYQDLVSENARRGKLEPEYELVDTGAFDDNRYWVVTVDYAKAAPRDLLMLITVENAGPDEATLHVLPTLWFRNTWSWGYDDHPKPTLTLDGRRIVGSHTRSGPLVMVGDGTPEPLFCENETNDARLFGGLNNTPYPKDGINDHVLHGADTVNPLHEGTKAALHYTVTVPPGDARQIKVRMVGVPHPAITVDPLEPSVQPIDLGADFDAVVASRKAEADA
ncbi:MAG TPA: glucosidase, partial [Nakamurella sp.]